MEDQLTARDRLGYCCRLKDIAEDVFNLQPFQGNQAGGGAAQHPHLITALHQRGD